mmetsp:Transcript_10474/g.19084  ORF Transcript_10474/g.19084 Transcript_10474/m.19084 type:complete len:205 (+) Transcript_10474:845-1459(+)
MFHAHIFEKVLSRCFITHLLEKADRNRIMECAHFTDLHSDTKNNLCCVREARDLFIERKFAFFYSLHYVTHFNNWFLNNPCGKFLMRKRVHTFADCLRHDCHSFPCIPTVSFHRGSYKFDCLRINNGGTHSFLNYFCQLSLPEGRECDLLGNPLKRLETTQLDLVRDSDKSKRIGWIGCPNEQFFQKLLCITIRLSHNDINFIQ